MLDELATRFTENLVGRVHGPMNFRMTLQPLLRSGWKSVGKIFCVALALDAVYQFVTVKWFYPGEALVTAAFLALVPYLFLRGPFNRLFPRTSAKGGGA